MTDAKNPRPGMAEGSGVNLAGDTEAPITGAAATPIAMLAMLKRQADRMSEAAGNAALEARKRGDGVEESWCDDASAQQAGMASLLGLSILRQSPQSLTDLGALLAAAFDLTDDVGNDGKLQASPQAVLALRMAVENAAGFVAGLIDLQAVDTSTRYQLGLCQRRKSRRFGAPGCASTPFRVAEARYKAAEAAFEGTPDDLERTDRAAYDRYEKTLYETMDAVDAAPVADWHEFATAFEIACTRTLPETTLQHKLLADARRLAGNGNG